MKPAATYYPRRGKFRLAEPLPDHRQATLDLLDSLPVHGLQPTTVRELLHVMACALVRLEYKARHEPDLRIGDQGVVQRWYVTYAAQAKALLYAAREHGDTDFPPGLPVPQPVIPTEADFRRRFLDAMDDGALLSGLDRCTDDKDTRRRDALYDLREQLLRAGVCRVREPASESTLPTVVEVAP